MARAIPPGAAGWREAKASPIKASSQQAPDNNVIDKNA
jgi:hypothetical protein